MLKAILWDMDGTLVDSEPLWAIATLEMSEAMGGRLTPEVHAQTVGVTFHQTVDICAAHAGVTPTPEERQQYYRTTIERVKELFRNNLQPNPGVRELLTDLKNHGIPMMVVTNTPRELANYAIKAVGEEFFHASICGDEVTNGKPAPDMYLQAAARLGVKTQHTLVFEDSPAGVQAALTARCNIIALPEPPTTPPAGVHTLEQLRGQPNFSGATASDVHHWFERITA